MANRRGTMRRRRRRRARPRRRTTRRTRKRAGGARRIALHRSHRSLGQAGRQSGSHVALRSVPTQSVYPTSLLPHTASRWPWARRCSKHKCQALACLRTISSCCRWHAPQKRSAQVEMRRKPDRHHGPGPPARWHYCMVVRDRSLSCTSRMDTTCTRDSRDWNGRRSGRDSPCSAAR